MRQKTFFEIQKRELENCNSIVREKFLFYSEKKINQRDDEKKWSIAENIAHLVIVNDSYLSQLEKTISNLSSDENSSGLEINKSFLGRIFLRINNPNSKMRYKTPKIFIPAIQRNDNSIIEKFLQSNEKLILLAEKFSFSNLSDVKVSSPLNSLIKFNIADIYLIINYHNERHLRQAKRVFEKLEYGK
ncbi:MAG: hypothetical protein C0425_06965 [Chlorobiaceae bacterium]|nr:hypothetical protein [Chlorobiaceae bacterium]MBA4310063.1 hypothetical protein [Chlorobiaceae bacterium]